MKHRTTWSVIVGAAAAGIVAAGCSSGRPPRAEIERADVALQRATSIAEAQRHAPLELRKAREKLEAARAAAREGNHERALFLAEEAEVDARLAEAKADAATARSMADETRRNIEVLREQAGREGSRAGGEQP
jgi:hypothetical protein